MLSVIQKRYIIFAGYLVPVLLATLSALLVASQVEKVREQADSLNESRIIAEDIGDLAFNVQILPRALRGYLLEKNQTSIDSYNDAKKEFLKLTEALNALIKDEQQKQNFKKLVDLVNQLDKFDQQLIDLVNQGKANDAIKEWRVTGTGQELSEQIATQLKVVRNREQEIIAIRRNHQEQALQALMVVVWLSAGISFVGALGLGWLIIASIIKQINQEATTIATASAEIATTIEEQERLAVQQASSVHETTTSMDELGASSRQATEQAASASNGANQVLTWVSGNHNSEQNLQNKVSLKEKMEQVQAQILRLSEHLDQINNMTGVVSDLANQTNMLALNASVEAVRAGEHGKGFGVVATEIRKLADRSKQSAEKINALVLDVQNVTHSTVMVTEEGTKAVNDIVGAINDVAVNIQQIYLNTKQQAIAVQQVVEAMNLLNVAAQETANGITQTKIGTQQLNQTALNLKAMI